MFTKHRSLLGIILIGLGWFSPAHAQSFRGLGDLPGGAYQSWANAISADGRVVVGTSWSSNGSSEGFRWENGVMTPLGDLNGGPIASRPTGVSADGSIIVGTSYDDPARAFRWQNGTMSALGDLGNGWPESEAYAISSDGSTIVGINHAEAFRWRNGVMSKIEGIRYPFFTAPRAVSADGSVVVGVTSAPTSEAFRWENGVMIGLGVLPDSRSSAAYAVSANGAVIVGESERNDAIEAFRWENGVMTGLGALPTTFLSISTARGVSADGRVIVGKSHTEATVTGAKAVVWFGQGAPVNLKDYAVSSLGLSAELAGWHLLEATGISADGRWIVGYGMNPQGNYEGWLLEIPASAGIPSAPVITTHPASQSSAPGGLVTFTAAADGYPSPTFQWQRNGINIAGATSASLTLSNVTTSDAGSYTVVATNSVGSAMSSSATLTVSVVVPTPPTTPTTPPTPTTPSKPTPSGGGGGGAPGVGFFVILASLAVVRCLLGRHRSITRQR